MKMALSARRPNTFTNSASEGGEEAAADMRRAVRLDDLLLCMLLVGRRKACVLVAKEDRTKARQRSGLDDDVDMVVIGRGWDV